MFAKAFLLILIFGLLILAIAFSFFLRVIFWIRDLLTGKDHSKYKATNSSFGYDFNRGASAQDNANAGQANDNYSQQTTQNATSQPKRKKKIYDDNEGEYAEFEEID